MKTLFIPRRLRFALLLLPVALFLTAFGCRPATKTNTNTNATNTSPLINIQQPSTNSTTSTTNLDVTNSVQPITRSATEEELSRLASAFAERYGSYSNQTDYENLESLYVFMTPSLAKATTNFVAGERKKKRDTSIYYGITARSVSVATKSLDEEKGDSSFLVTTFRKETIGPAANTKSFQQDLLVSMAKNGGAWKVDQATWQAKR